ncbi:hypothetical protein BBJ28_00019466 [Nothophytophthora sp. Chile5]|nr:hypothetical protein BBJ28_00019466 [Nothophytophthora sp. Chile5]
MAASRVCLDGFRSPADKRHYRLVTLVSGLEALLIQSETGSAARGDDVDVDNTTRHSELTPSTATRALRGSVSSADETDSDSLAEEGEGPEESSEHAPLAAACLVVGVGSLSDPEGLPGLAHYLEHMVFMGSEKYPAEDAFEAFLSAHGGSSNGKTECEATHFVFDVDAQYLEPALDMFAQLFVAPLLRRESMARELLAVEAEFQRVRQNDAVRLQQVQCQTSAAGHSYSRCFTWGNAESLKRLPETRGIDVREQMWSFFQTHYSASAMKLCVYGRESLDELEQYVTQSFSEISRSGGCLEVPRNEVLTVPFGAGAGQNPTLLRVVPVGEQRTMRMYWMLPPMISSYRQKPWQYVAHLLGHEGPDSVTSTLKRRHWATDVVTGVSDRDAYEFGSFGTLFEVRVSLTEKGLRSWQQVAQIIFDALHDFTSLALEDGEHGGLPIWVFEELRSASEMHFRFQEDDKAAVAFCREFAERMQPRHCVQRTYPGDLLRYDLIQGEFDASAAGEVLTGLSVDNVRVVLVASSFSNSLDSQELQMERWLGAQYTVNPIPSDVLAGWRQVSENSELSPLPMRNPFMPRDFALLPGESEAQSDTDVPPELVMATATTQLWYKRDRTFQVPKAIASFLVALPTPTASTLMLVELHVDLVRRRLQHTLEQAEAANFDVELEVRDEAIEVVVSGFSDSLPALVRVIMLALVTPSPSKLVQTLVPELALAREELEREYRNATLSPGAKARELRLQLLESGAVSTNDKLQALQSQDGRDRELARELTHFVTVTLGRGTGAAVMRCLVVGNMNREAVIALVLDVEAARAGATAELTSEPELEPTPEPLIPATRCHTIALPPTKNGLLVRRLSERIEERNSMVEVYFQLGKVGAEDRAYALLLRALLDQPLFHELRTRQQLGYAVTCGVRETHGVLGLSVSVQSASHAAGAVAQRLDAFLHDEFPNEFLRSEQRLSSQHFAAHVLALQRSVSRPDATLVEQSERYWEEITSGRLDFDLDARVAQALSGCTHQGLLERYNRWLVGSTSCCSSGAQAPQHRNGKGHHHGPRKLRVHVVGRCSPFKPFEQIVSPERAPQLITGDLREFQRELQCHCYHSSSETAKARSG